MSCLLLKRLNVESFNQIITLHSTGCSIESKMANGYSPRWLEFIPIHVYGYIFWPPSIHCVITPLSSSNICRKWTGITPSCPQKSSIKHQWKTCHVANVNVKILWQCEVSNTNIDVKYNRWQWKHSFLPAATMWAQEILLLNCWEILKLWAVIVCPFAFHPSWCSCLDIFILYCYNHLIDCFTFLNILSLNVLLFVLWCIVNTASCLSSLLK